MLCATSVWAGREFVLLPGEEAVADELIVRLKPGADLAAVLSASAPGSQIAFQAGIRTHLVRTLPGQSSNASSGLARNASVEFVEPNRVRRHMGGLPALNDPNANLQWALTTVNALSAWNIIPDRFLTASSAGSGRIRVAILDTGADCSHSDFKNSGGSSVDSAQGGQLNFTLSQALVATTLSSPACPWQDDYGHGTHVTGIIAAATQNAAGIASLGYPIEVVSYKVLDSNGRGNDFTISQAVRAAADAGIHFVSMSLGGAGYSQTFQDAINYAWERNTLTIAAAGNGNSNSLFFPGGGNYVIGVAATDSNNSKASFSNWGPYNPDIAAPGVNIYSTMPGYPNPSGIQNYGNLSGTSMATPHVSALAGLVGLTTPGFSVAAIAQRIEQSANSTFAGGGWDQYLGYGIIDASRAVTGNLRSATVGGIVGQIVDGTGLPVTGATVTAGGQNFTTLSDGLYRLSGLTAGSYNVQVSASGYLTRNLTFVVRPGADATATIAMGVVTGNFTGTVTSGGAALGGAIVQALISGLIKGTAVSDFNGLYVLPMLPGTYDIQVSGVSRITTTVPSKTISAGGTLTVNLTLPGMGTIAGTVRDNNSNLLANAQVTFSQSGTIVGGAITNSNGQYSSIGLPTGTYSVTASSSGLPDSTVSGVVVSADTANAVNLTLSTSAPTIVTSSPLPAGVVGTSYTGVTFSATGGTSPYNWAVTGGALPPGLTMTNGTLSGTPTTANTYNFTVTVTDSASQTSSKGFSLTITTPQSGGLPAGWSSQNIGAVPPGSASYNNGTFTVTGSGVLTYPSDKFFYAYKPLNGDATVIARIASAQYSGQAIVGVMIRESLTPGARYFMVGHRADFQLAVLSYRPDNLDTYSQTGSNYLALPMWVKLVRQGNLFTGYGSSDGVTWTPAGSVTLSIGSSAFVGLVASPQNATSGTATATFDNVTAGPDATPNFTMTATPTTATTTAGGNASYSLTVTPSGGFSAQVSYSCTGPQGFTCTFNPASTSGTSPATVTATVTAPANAAAGSNNTITLIGTGGAITQSVNVTLTIQSSIGLPAGWLSQNIGQVPSPGSASYNNGTFTVTGSGLLTYPSDKFFYAYKPLNGDATVIARIASAQYSGQAIVGVMIRESLTPGARYFMVGHRADFQLAVLSYRADNLDTYSQTGSNYLALPMWVKLVRQGNVFTGYGSPDGVTWTPAGSVTLSIGSSAFVGLVASPQDSTGSGTATATFDNVTTGPDATPNFTLTATPNTATTTAGGNASYSLTVTPSGGFSAQVSYSCTGPQGFTCTFNPSSTSGTSPATVTATVTAPANAAAGSNNTITLIGTGGAITQSVNVTLSIQSSVGLPAGWLSQNIGQVPSPGSASYNNGTFTVTGSGVLTYPSDKLFYAYKPLNGDATVIARIASAQYSGQGIVGVMIRESLTPGARYAMVGHRADFQLAVLSYRADNLDTYSQTGSNYLAVPMWVKLVRQGNVFTGYGSSDGVTWTPAGSVTLSIGSSAFVGLVASPQDATGSGTASATFDSVTVP